MKCPGHGKLSCSVKSRIISEKISGKSYLLLQNIILINIPQKKNRFNYIFYNQTVFLRIFYYSYKY